MVPDVDGLALGEHRQRHLEVRLGLGVRVVLDRLVHPLGHHVLLDRHAGLGAHRRGDLAEPFVDRGHDLVLGVARQNPVEHELAEALGDRAPVAADQVQALGLLGVAHLAVLPLLHHQGGVLLLLEEEHRLEDPVQLELERLVQLVHLPFHLLPELLDVLQVGGVGVDHDGVRVAVDHLHVELRLRQVHRALQGLPPHGRHERRDGLGVEPRVGEAEAAVQRVGRELEGLLADVQRLPFRGVFLLLEDVLHPDAPLDDRADHLGDHPRLEGVLRQRRQRKGAPPRADRARQDLGLGRLHRLVPVH
mmetsp:Transcript_12988/g.30644  ORF Transcript_12988/g.30644 Transcript_12988/m.30644 type:complete len:305 (+) Transcript_12988:1043-1957(+)